MDLPWELMDVELTIDLNGVARIELGVWGRRTRYDVESGELHVGGRAGTRVAPVDGKLKLRIFVDCCTVDVCAQDGRAFLMAGMQPNRGKPALEAFAEGRKAVISNIKIHRLKSAVETEWQGVDAVDKFQGCLQWPESAAKAGERSECRERRCSSSAAFLRSHREPGPEVL